MNNRHILTEQEFNLFVSLVVDYQISKYQASSNTLLEGDLLKGFKAGLSNLTKKSPKLKAQVSSVFSKIKGAGAVPSEFFKDLLDIAKEFPGSLNDLLKVIQSEAGVLEEAEKQPLKVKKSIIAKIRDFNKKYQGIVRSTLAGFAFMVLANSTIGVGNKAETSKVTDLETGNTSLTQPAFKVANKLDPGKNVYFGGGGGTTVDIDPPHDPTVKAAQGFGIDVDGDANIQTYGVGDGDMSPDEIDAAAKAGADRYLNLTDKQVDQLKSGDKVILKGKSGGTISNQTDDGDATEDQSDTGKGSLKDKRADNASKITKKMLDFIKQGLKKKGINKPIEVEQEDNVGFSKTDSQKANNNPADNSADQASIEDVDMGVEDGGNITYIQYYTDQFKAPKLVPGGEPEGEPTGEPAAGAQGEKARDRAAGPIILQVADIEKLPRLGRNAQLAYLFAVATQGKSDLFRSLGKSYKTPVPIENNKLTALTKSTDQKVADLANAIEGARKDKRGFLNKLAPALGVQLRTATKAKMTQPGQKGQAYTPTGYGQVQETSKHIASLYEQLMQEARYDSFIELVKGLSDEEKSSILGIIGSMYQAEGGTVSIVNTKDLDPAYAKKIMAMGFGNAGPGKGYVFMEPGEAGKAAASNVGFDKKTSQKTEPDVDRLGKSIQGKQTLEQYFDTINKKEEVTQLVLGLLNMYDTSKLDKQKLDTALTTAVSRINEQTSADVEKLLQFIERDVQIKSNLSRIDNVEEAIQTILRVALVFINDDFKQNKAQLKQAIQDAITQFRAKGATPQSSTQSKNVSTTMPGTNFKYEITEQVKRFQKLAGII